MMSGPLPHVSNETHELSVERHIAAPPAHVWQIMTERLTEWWCPKPWRTEIIEQDWRAGGRSAMVMRGPNGEESPMDGIFLEVVAGQKFVITNAITVGWVPQTPFMIGIFEITPEGTGTHYRASARHWDEVGMKKHQDMGFEQGWGAVADQLKVLAEGR
ncbi:MAG: SRPBCC family protein [Sphingobium sp.]